jgi:hypothetical protein
MAKAEVGERVKIPPNVERKKLTPMTLDWFGL